MGADCIGTLVKDDLDGMSQFPPGFAPIALLNMHNAQDLKAPANASEALQYIMRDDKSSVTLQISQDLKNSRNAPEFVQCTTKEEKSRKSLRERPSINYRQFDTSSDEESDYEPFEEAISSTRRLPKGVFRGCAKCENCQKVTARWKPQDARKPVLDNAPVFYPTEEEFKDTIKYIATIRQSAEQYGICRIVPPSSWNPTCLLKQKQIWGNSKFATRIQQVDKLQNRLTSKKMGRSHIFMRGRRKALKTENTNEEDKAESNCCNNVERFGFVPGPDFTLESFETYADEFKRQYFSRSAEFVLGSCQQEPSVDDIEGEYWRIVERPTEEIEVLYGADVDTGVFSSGFPKELSSAKVPTLEDQYMSSGWNLNNFPRLPGSVLSFESGDISGVLVPWLYVGMCFSSFCWHVEDHHLYSLNYMHWGAPKIWYGVAGKDALKLEEAMKKNLPDLFEEQPDLLHNLVTQFSPSLLRLEGVPVYRCVQNEGEFVLTFPRAYHSGFNSGFNCAEAVNVAPVDWLLHGQHAVELYREQGRRISISHDKLLLGAAREAIRAQWNILFLRKNTPDNLRWKNLCGPGSTLVKALKERIDMERARRENLCSSQSAKMDSNFDTDCERECFICHYDLYISATKCECSPDKYACLVHAKQLCSCALTMRSFLFRYEISELNVLLDALAGKLSAIHRWGLIDLGLSLSSHVTKEKAQECKQVLPACKEGTTHKDNTMANQKRTVNARCSSYKDYDASKLQHFEGIEERKRKTHDMDKSTGEHADDASKYLSVVTDQNSILSGLNPRANGCSHAPSVVSSESQHSSNSTLNHVILQTNSSEITEIKSTSVSVLGNTEPKTCYLSGGGGIAPVANEVKDAKKSLTNKIEEASFVCSESLSRLLNSEDKVTSCSSHKDQDLITPQTNASLLSEKEIHMLPVMATSSSKNLSSIEPDVKMQQKVTFTKYSSNILDQQLLTVPFGKASECPKSANDIITSPLTDPSYLKETNGGDSSKFLQNHQFSGGDVQIYESKGKIESSPENNGVDRRNPIATSSASYPQNNIDKYYLQQKGPRIAKVVRRVNCNVQVLEYGVMLSGKLWSTSQAIFPKGYRSRVRYFSVLDPTQMCCYISEILDAGLLGPLFMVVVEQCPSEVFIHVSATKCWDMVREKVNDQIRQHRGTGRQNLPPLQPPGSLDGLEMFGLSSPKILQVTQNDPQAVSSISSLQAIQALDQDFVCTEYWRSRPKPPAADTQANSTNSQEQRPTKRCRGIGEDPSQTASFVSIRGLFKKANMDELHSLQTVLGNDPSNKSNQELMHTVNEEIKSRNFPT
ncbi:putative lysine-specific demethylase JMJ16 isoform X2 [Zingiber officinale]|nr:putative lysine-specific demethylase JMJ16 isoform X2 [Zingiber officinale]